jgi:uncharacterized protein YcnI
MRIPRTLAAVTAVGLAVPAVAGAHVTPTPSTAPADDYAAFTLRVGHGCEDSPTTRVTVQIPDQVVSATPEVVPGWRVSTKEGKLAEPFDNHGETITEGVRQVTWTGGPLDPHQYTEFGLSVRFHGTPGEVVPFKTIQRCEQGENPWIQVAQPGEAEPEFPAPAITLTAADGGHGADAGSDHAADAETAPVADVAAPASVDDGDDGPSTGLVVAALVLGAIGALLGGAALLGRRGRTS